jgi:hypothetical protein
MGTMLFTSTSDEGDRVSEMLDNNSSLTAGHLRRLNYLLIFVGMIIRINLK